MSDNGWPPDGRYDPRDDPSRYLPAVPTSRDVDRATPQFAVPPGYLHLLGQGGRLVKRRVRIIRWIIGGVVLVGLASYLHKAVLWFIVLVFGPVLSTIGIRLPHVPLEWPWTTGQATDTIEGAVLQKIEGINRVALGTENFDFIFTHKVSRSIGPWPCWYQSTFSTTGHASATVDLNPGPSWWETSTGHYQLHVVTKPAPGVTGSVSVVIALPLPQLPQSVHDVTVDNTLSHPIDTQHSWTYPGIGCGALIRPQFAESVLYAQAQQIAYTQATKYKAVTRPLISAAEAKARQIIQDNFVQPTVNALGYDLTSFKLVWVSPPPAKK